VDQPWVIALGAVLLLVAVGWYLSYLAARLDRLHHRVETSSASLAAQLARRAAAALRAAGELGDPSGDGLVAAGRLRAAAARAAGSSRIGPVGPTRPVEAVEAEVDVDAENALTRALHDAFPAGSDPPGRGRAGTVTEELVAAQQRVQLARRFHNDAVAHARRMRGTRVVRWARLAGHARMPEMVELDDSLPPGLDDDPPLG
jgi:hypothetical protein